MLNIPAFEWPLKFCAFSTVATYVLSIITGNVSQVDRVWTFLPTIYTAYFALLPLWPNSPAFPGAPFVPEELKLVAKDFSPRAVLMLSVVTIWMCRLSYNTYRRGLFNLHDEDYRWAVLRTQLSPFLFQVVNLTFIAITQNVLLLLMGIPTYYAVTQPHTGLVASDYACALTALVLVALEFTADNQQYAFQTFKYSYQGKAAKYDEAEQWPGARFNWTTEDAERGFVTKGLWAYVRHPNFACEQLFWWVITLVPILAPAPPQLPHYHWNDVTAFITNPITIDLLKNNPKVLFDQTLNVLASCYPLASGIFYSILFFSSTPYTEAITAKKYPAYLAYQKRVGMFSLAGTVRRGLWITLLEGNAKRKELEGLIFGTGKGKAKAE